VVWRKSCNDMGGRSGGTENRADNVNIDSVNRPTPFPNLLDAVYATALLVASPLLAYRLARTGKWRSDWKGRLGHAHSLPADPRPTILLHGVSVGEVAAADPLIQALGGPAGRGPCRVVVSTTTNTGAARAESLYGQHHRVVRYPLDFGRSVARFLDRIQPDVVALLELEVWPNFTAACQRRGIPVVVVNGRLSEGSFQGYRRLRPLLRPSFQRLAGVAAQTEDYAERFEAMGVSRDRIAVTDSMKWEAPLPQGLHPAGEELGREMGVDPDRPLVVAVSTGPGEEAPLLEGRPEGVQLMVVPRKPERFEEVARLAPWTRRSEGGRGTGDLFLVDTMGEAEAATALADVVVVGRTFNGMGGSNPVPAAALGKPTVLGPDHQNFAEMVRALVDGGAALVSPEPWLAVERVLDDDALRRDMSQAGPRTVANHAGATAKNVEVVRQQLR
jgi:3-deoxy-D-manno-octulosonic-acid transferase